uniref:Uncharacterized protein n=1 Tax=Salix viminalis TaxID=40686 RepID=A0A6N2N2C3_SALVM
MASPCGIYRCKRWVASTAVFRKVWLSALTCAGGCRLWRRWLSTGSADKVMRLQFWDKDAMENCLSAKKHKNGAKTSVPAISRLFADRTLLRTLNTIIKGVVNSKSVFNFVSASRSPSCQRRSSVTHKTHDNHNEDRLPLVHSTRRSSVTHKTHHNHNEDRLPLVHGSVKSLISMPCFMSHASILADVREARGLIEDLIRISVGIEDVNFQFFF